MRIAFLLPSNAIAGGVYVAYQHAHFLAAQGHDVTILFVSAHDGLEVKGFPGFSLKTQILQAAVDGKSTWDVVFATWWETFYEMFVLPSKHYFYFCQSDERRFYPSQMSEEVPFVEKTYCNPKIGIVTEAKWIRGWLEKDYGATVEYAPNGIDNRLFCESSDVKVPKGNRVRVLIEGPGSLAYKRIDLAFRVASQVDGIELWYVSTDGVVKPHWKASKIFSRVPFTEMPAIYRSCDILLKLSTVEGFFGPPLEMMACGGTAVVSKVTGYDEYIRDGENALAVEMDDEKAACEAINRLVKDSQLRKKLSQNGMATARSMDWSQRSPLFEQAMLRLMERTAPLSIVLKNDYRVTNELRKQSARISYIHKEIFNWRPFRLWKSLLKKVRKDKIIM